MSQTPSPSALASPADEAWALVRSLFRPQRARFLIASSELGLHPAQAGALLQLEGHAPLSMHELAGRLACDNSNVTGIVDRLESRGLVARRPYEHDRRVKHIALTALGADLREQLLERIAPPPPGFRQLSPQEQVQLRDLLLRVVGETG